MIFFFFRFKSQMQITKTLAIVLCAYFGCYFPLFIYTYAVKVNTFTLYIVQMILYIIWSLNMIINPFIYAIRDDSYLQAYKRILRIGQVKTKTNSIKRETPPRIWVRAQFSKLAGRYNLYLFFYNTVAFKPYMIITVIVSGVWASKYNCVGSISSHII